MTRLLLALFNLILTALIVGLVGLVLFGTWLQTPFGSAWLSQKASTLASDATGYTIRAEGLAAGWPFSIGLKRLDVADTAGPWLAIEGLSLDWNPLALLQNKLHVQTLSVDRLELLRAPLAPPTTQDTPATQKEPELYLDVAKVQINQLLAADAITHLGPQTVSLTVAALQGTPRDLLGQLRLQAAASSAWPDALEASVRFRATETALSLQDVALSSLGATLSGSAHVAEDKLEAELTLVMQNLATHTPLSGALEGKFTLSGTPQNAKATVALTVPNAQLEGQNLGALSAQLNITHTPETTCLQNLKLVLPATTGQGDVCVESKTDKLTGAALISIKKLETLARLIPDLPAVSGQAELKIAPQNNTQLAFTLSHQGQVVGKKTTLNASGTVSTTALSLARLSASVNAVPLRLQQPTSLQIVQGVIKLAPTRLSLGKSLWQLTFMQTRDKLDSQIAFQQVDDTLLGLIAPELQQLAITGKISGKATLFGKPQAPQLEATASLADGTYQDPTTGLRLLQISAQAQLKDKLVTLERLSATDGKDGTLSATGTLQLGTTKALPLEIKARFAKLRALRLETAKATASGQILLSGDLNMALHLSGRVDVDDAFFAIPKRLPLSLIQLPITETGGPPRQPRSLKKAEMQTKTLLPIVLDLTINAPARVRVEGRGLTSELNGTLHVKGTADAPDIQGQLGIVRGTYEFLGKTLALSQGHIRFDRGTLTDPSLELDATQTAPTLTTTVHVRGAASAPVITFDSSPALPQDEIIARMLFGHGMSQLSPVESVQLAAALASLVSDSDTPDIKGKIRRTLGLDTLDITSTTTNPDGTQSSALKAGKYITDDVFLHVQQGLTPQSQAAGLEVRLTPTISLESSIGAGAQTDLSVKVQRDY